jgi:hypothetical protein
MNLTDAIHVWRRRWILTILLLVVALAGAAGALLKLPKHYQAQSDVVLLPSTSTSALSGHNPYLAFNGSLPMTAQILSYQILNPSSLEKLAAQGYTENFAVSLAPTAGGAPILNVQVTGSNKDAVEQTLHGVTDAIGSRLSALQIGIARTNQITAMTLSVDAQPSLSLSKTEKPLIIILGLGVALALAIPLIVDGGFRTRVPTDTGNKMYPPADRPVPSEASRYNRQQVPDEAVPSAANNVLPPDATMPLRIDVEIRR